MFGRYQEETNLLPLPTFEPRVVQPVACLVNSNSRPTVSGSGRYCCTYSDKKVKVMQSRYRPGGAQRVPGSYGSQISWQRHRMVVRLSALRTGRLYPQEMLLVLPHSAIGSISCQWKFPMISAGIEPATFRFVAQHLNHCATLTRSPVYIMIVIIN